MGPVKPTLTRMGLMLCIDGVPAFHGNHRGAPSLLIAELANYSLPPHSRYAMIAKPPAELINFSLPPHIRYDPDNMMCWALIPDDMPADAQLKYFKYMIATGVTLPPALVMVVPILPSLPPS